MKKKKITELLIFIVSAELVGALSALLTGDFMQNYYSLAKPPLSPPGFVFPLVWTILYALMGVSAFLIFASDKPQSKRNAALTIYGAQLFINFLWSIIYFRFNSPIIALIDIIILGLLLIMMIKSFYKIRHISAFLNIPYLLWIIFATYLNFVTIILN